MTSHIFISCIRVQIYKSLNGIHSWNPTQTHTYTPSVFFLFLFSLLKFCKDVQFASFCSFFFAILLKLKLFIDSIRYKQTNKHCSDWVTVKSMRNGISLGSHKHWQFLTILAVTQKMPLALLIIYRRECDFQLWKQKDRFYPSKMLKSLYRSPAIGEVFLYACSVVHTYFWQCAICFKWKCEKTAAVLFSHSHEHFYSGLPLFLLLFPLTLDLVCLTFSCPCRILLLRNWFFHISDTCNQNGQKLPFAL